MRQTGESRIVQIDRAQSRGARPRYIRCGLQDVELCSQSSCEITLGRIERFVCRLHISCLGFEHALGLLKVEKRAAYFGSNAPARCCQSFHRCLAPGARCLHPPFGREPVEDVPRCIYSYHTAVVKFLADLRITLAVNLVPGKSANMRAHGAPVQDILSIFDLDILLPGFEHWSACVSPGQAVV